MRFDEAMSTTCGRCNKPASRHRLTSRGQFYCLVLNRNGILYENYQHIKDELAFGSLNLATISVKYLTKSRLPKGVAAIIKDGIRNYAGSDGLAATG
jgi:hypothetical protein